MPDNLSTEGKRLLRRTFSSDPRTPWWVRWIVNLTVLAIVVVGGAWLIDHIWVDWRGRPAWASCALVGLLPWGLAPVIGLVLGVAGLIAFLMSQRPAGIGMMVLGVGFYTLPEVLMASTLGAACPWVPFGG